MHLAGLEHLWHRVVDRTAAPPHGVVVATALLALAMVAWRPIWRIVRNPVTIAHEGGHAALAVLAGRKLHGIRLHADTSGATATVGRARGPGLALTLLAGYPMPPLLGLAGAALLAAGRTGILLLGCVALLLVVLVLVRNVYGVIAVLLTAAAVVALSWYVKTEIQTTFAYAGVWLLLVGGVRPVWELQSDRRAGRLPDSDADQLARVALLPAIVWVGVFWLTALAALVLGGYLLIRPLLPAGGLR